jgi:dipeptidyl aminopeptidase/acylaminoacyl peptidase
MKIRVSHFDAMRCEAWPALVQKHFACRLLAALCVGASLLTTSVAADERPLHRFLEITLSPDGAVVASVEGNASRSGSDPPLRDLVLRRTDGSAQMTVTLPCGRVEQCWPSSPAWSPDAKHLSFALRNPGTHARSLYRVDADGDHAVKLLDFNGTLTGLRYAHDGRLAVLAIAGAQKEVGATEAGAPVTGDLGGPPPEQRIAIIDGPHFSWASPADLFVYEYDWQPDGKGFVGTAAHGDGDSNWWIAKLYAFDATTASERIIYNPQSSRQQLANPRVSRDGRTVAFIAGLMSDASSTGGDVLTLPLAGGPAMTVTPGIRASAESLGWDCDGRLLAALIRNGTIEIADLGDGTASRAPRIEWSGPESIASRSESHLSDADLSLACPSRESATVRENFVSPPEIIVGQVGQWRPLTAINAGMSAPAQVQSITWKSDEFDVRGWLLLPSRATGKLPLITMVHGGPAAAAMPAFIGPGLSRTLLEKDYALFLPNPRGSFGQGEAFVTANVRDLGHGDLRDILAGIDAVKRTAAIDDGRLGITGRSYGGFMSMWAVTQTNVFKAAVAVAGLSNWQSYYGQNGIDAWMIPYFGASVYDAPETYARSSPINFIRNVRTPTLAYVGADDIETPAPQTQEFWHALKELGIPTSMVIYPDEGHHLRDPKHVADAERRTLAWFDKYLR